MKREEFKVIFNKFREREKELQYEVFEYKIIFKENKEITNKFDFFGRLNQMYWLNFIIKIYALFDKDKDFKKKGNLSLNYIIKEYKSLISEFSDLNKPKENSEIIDKLHQETIELISSWKFIRNKNIGHYDIDSIFSTTLKQILYINDLDIVLNNLDKILNLINEDMNYPVNIFFNKKSEAQKVMTLLIEGQKSIDKNG